MQPYSFYGYSCVRTKRVVAASDFYLWSFSVFSKIIIK